MELHKSIVSRRGSSNRSLYCKVIPKPNVLCYWIFIIKLYGENVIAIDVKSYCKLFVEDVFSPSLIFKVFCMKLWSLSDYVLLCRLHCIFNCSVTCHISLPYM